jgi:hypothetical protein
VPRAAAARLARDRSDSVRRTLAANPSVPAEHVVALLSDENEYVARAAASNPGLPQSVAHDLVRAAGL